MPSSLTYATPVGAQALRNATKILQTADAVSSEALPELSYIAELESIMMDATQAVGVFEEHLCTVARLLVFGEPQEEEVYEGESGGGGRLGKRFGRQARPPCVTRAQANCCKRVFPVVAVTPRRCTRPLGNTTTAEKTGGEVCAGPAASSLVRCVLNAVCVCGWLCVCVAVCAYLLCVCACVFAVYVCLCVPAVCDVSVAWPADDRGRERDEDDYRGDGRGREERRGEERRRGRRYDTGGTRMSGESRWRNRASSTEKGGGSSRKPRNRRSAPSPEAIVKHGRSP